MMNVLWFVNMIPKAFADAVGREGTNYQGWIAGLADAVQQFAPEIKLTIVCEGTKHLSAKINGVSYCTIGKANAACVSECILQERPDVVHLHGSEGEFPVLPTSVWHGVPVCMSLQGIIHGCAPQYLGGLDEAELNHFLPIYRKLHIGCSEVRIAHEWQSTRCEMEKKAFKNISNVLGRTQWDCEWTRRLNPAARYFQVGEILRTPFYSGKRDGKQISRHTIFCGGAFDYPLKRGHLLLGAVSILKDKYPDIRLRVANSKNVLKPASFKGNILWGQYHRYLNWLIGNLGLWNNLEILPSLSSEEFRRELQHAELFCLPSAMENSSNSLGEALMTGTPSVVMNVGGNLSIMHPNEGLVVNEATPSALTAAIADVFDNPAAAKERADLAYVRAMSTYDKSVVIKQLVSAYQSIVGLKE